MNDIYTKSLELHKKMHGKLETQSKIPLTSREELSLAYTPGVAAVCELLAKEPEKAREYTLKHNTIAIVSDGSAILGLGNLGATASIPVMEGKAAIFKEFAQVDAFPICLDTQDTEEIIKAVKQIAPVFGGINLEDISAPRCFEIETRLRQELSIPVMHDDQWGAATVTLTALINSLKLKGMSKDDAKVVLSGIGAAGVATARLLLTYGIKHITFVDSKGIITSSRSDLTKEKTELLSQSTAPEKEGDIADALIGADVFIGLSKPGVLTENMVKTMNDKPVIFALANPTPEIMPDVALSAGAFIVATGRSDFPNQINNSLVFPGAFRGMLRVPGAQFQNNLFIEIAEGLAAYTQDISTQKILPSMFDDGVADKVTEIVIQHYS